MSRGKSKTEWTKALNYKKQDKKGQLAFTKFHFLNPKFVVLHHTKCLLSTLVHFPRKKYLTRKKKCDIIE